MADKITPAVTMMCDFVLSSKTGSSFGGYLDYMNRPEAFEAPEPISGQPMDPLYSGYMDYMRNDDKSDGLFTGAMDHLSEPEVSMIKDRFNDSQKKGCPLYRGIISFDNSFLKDLGLFTSGSPDQYKVKEVARSAISTLIKKSHLDPEHVIWTGAIHTNTDNVHVHFSVIEDRKEVRRKDMLPIDAIDAAKSVVVNKLLGSEESILRTKLLREYLLPGVREISSEHRDVLIELMKKLPTNEAWVYGRKSFEPYRLAVDQAVNTIISSNPTLKAHFDTFVERLNAYENQVRRFYGDGERRLWESTKDNRLQDFYLRAGNILLKEIQVAPTSHERTWTPLMDEEMLRFSLLSAVIDESVSKGADIVPILESGVTDQMMKDSSWLLELDPQDVTTHILYPGCDDQKILLRFLGLIQSEPDNIGKSENTIRKSVITSINKAMKEPLESNPESRTNQVSANPSVRSSFHKAAGSPLPHNQFSLDQSCASALRRINRQYEARLKELEREYERSQDGRGIS